MEDRLKYYGIEYTKAIVPDTDAVQLFFFDPHGYARYTLHLSILYLVDHPVAYMYGRHCRDDWVVTAVVLQEWGRGRLKLQSGSRDA